MVVLFRNQVPLYAAHTFFLIHSLVLCCAIFWLHLQVLERLFLYHLFISSYTTFGWTGHIDRSGGLGALLWTVVRWLDVHRKGKTVKELMYYHQPLAWPCSLEHK